MHINNNKKQLMWYHSVSELTTVASNILVPHIATAQITYNLVNNCTFVSIIIIMKTENQSDNNPNSLPPPSLMTH